MPSAHCVEYGHQTGVCHSTYSVTDWLGSPLNRCHWRMCQIDSEVNCWCRCRPVMSSDAVNVQRLDMVSCDLQRYLLSAYTTFVRYCVALCPSFRMAGSRL